MNHSGPFWRENPTDITHFASPDTIQAIEEHIDALKIYIVDRIRRAGPTGCSIRYFLQVLDVQERFTSVVQRKLWELVQQKKIRILRSSEEISYVFRE